MADAGDIIVLDVGKTLSKLSRWSKDGVMLAKVTRPNAKAENDGVAVLDESGIGTWLSNTLRDWAKHGKVSAIIPIGHGAGVAAIRDGQLAFPSLDYEQAIPEEVMAAYRGQRDPFAETGSPALPMGLNIGAQLHWLDARLDGVTLLPWAQYWSWFLSGVATSEVTSLGCHSDLWNPAAGDYSALAKKRGWANQFAPLAKAGDVIGTLKPEFGLGEGVHVHAGIHDSNAALIAARGFVELDGREATVLSTGTWFIAMRSPQEPVDLASLPEARDCLVNIDADGVPVPSARFMGGREIELLGTRIDLAEDQEAALGVLPAIIGQGAMILPSFAQGSGPFKERQGEWINKPRDAHERRTVIALYAALVAETSLGLIGAKSRILVEGRFAASEAFTRALATLRLDIVVYVTDEEVDVSFGALRLVNPSLCAPAKLRRVLPFEIDLTAYRKLWKQRITGGTL